MGIVSHRDLRDSFPDVSNIGLYVVIKLDGIEISLIDLNRIKALRVFDPVIVFPVLNADDRSFDLTQKENSGVIVSSESIGKTGNIFFYAALVKRVNISLGRRDIVKHPLGFIELVKFVYKHNLYPLPEHFPVLYYAEI